MPFESPVERQAFSISGASSLGQGRILWFLFPVGLCFLQSADIMTKCATLLMVSLSLNLQQ